MPTLLFHHDIFAKHDTGYGHPERIERINSVLSAMQTLPELQWQEAPQAAIERLTLIHPAAFVDTIMAAIPQPDQGGHTAIDGDTIVSPDSGSAALHAVGALCAAVDAVVGTEADNAFCAVRPPGHHAEPEQSMGFCLFNSVAIAAVYAQQQYGLERVAVLEIGIISL